MAGMRFLFLVALDFWSSCWFDTLGPSFPRNPSRGVVRRAKSFRILWDRHCCEHVGTQDEHHSIHQALCNQDRQ